MAADQDPSNPHRSAGKPDETADSRAAGAVGGTESSVFALGSSMFATDSDASSPTVRSGVGGRGERGGAGGERPGAVIGRYKLLQQIGEGGFGAVYLAEQEVPVRRQVALKIIKLGMDTKQVIARFEAERQALALMEHPNIAKVLDAGATDTGRPYFVMELVRGVPITEYCDQAEMPFRDRLNLFMQVCGAVQHAHQKGIIHRDIKPSNVLVTQVDGKPAPKVIDFGIAKATQQRLTEQTMFTEFGQFIGTPAYMSPEQADATGTDIDTRSDIYSLGVLLYELLTGATPFDVKTLRKAGLGEIQRIIREVEPPRPSTRLSGLGAELETVARQRSIEPKKLGTILRGDLDWIILKALEKDRVRRYESASGLAADIERYLVDEPVAAGPPSNVYRFRKFVRRHRGAVIAGAVVTATLVLGVIGTSVGMVRALQEKRRADAAAQAEAAARREEQKRGDELKQVSDFQAKMLSQIDATGAGIELMSDIREKFAAALKKSGVPEAERPKRVAAFGRELTHVNATDVAADMIDRTILMPAIVAVDSEFKDQPLVDSSLRQTLGELYRTLGRNESAFSLQERALEVRRRVLGGEHADTLDAEWNLARILRSQGKLAEAEPLTREAMEKRRRVLGDDHPDTLASINTMATLLQDQGKLAEAEPLMREAMEKGRRVLGEEHADTVNYIGHMGLLLDARGKSSEAEPYLREAMEKSRRVRGEDDPNTVNAINNYGCLLLALGRAPDAEKYLREALDKERRVRGEEHPDTLLAINNVATVLERQGRIADAEPVYRDALEKSRRVLGDEHPATLRAINNLGNNLRSQGKLAEAEPLIREAMGTYRRVLGDEHRETLIAINVYGYLLIEQGKPAEAEPYWREAYEKGRRALGEDHPDVLVWTNNLGGLLRSQGKLAEAEPYLREALSKSRRVNGNDHPSTLYIMRSVAALLYAQGKKSEAELLYREVMETRRRVLGTENVETLTSIAEMGGVLRKAGKLPESEALFREAIPGFVRVKGKDNSLTGDARMGLARGLIEQKRFGEAEPEIIEAERIFSAPQGIPPDRYKPCVESLVTLYEAWDKAEPGKGYDAKAAEWKEKFDAMNPSPPSTQPGKS